jgi:chromosome segregation ATPase
MNYTELLNNYNMLNQTCQQLQTNYNHLVEQYTLLNETYTKLLINHENLNQTYQETLNNYNTLNKTYQELMTNYTQLENDYNTLLNKYNSLNSTYTSLATEYTNIQNILQYTSLAAIAITLTTSSLAIKNHKKFKEQKRLAEKYKIELEQISLLHTARSQFEADVERRKKKIEIFEQKYGVTVKPRNTLEDIITELELKKKKGEKE